MPTTHNLDWWKDTYNTISASIPAAQSVSEVRNHQSSTFADTTRIPQPHARLNVSAHHAQLLSDTPGGRLVCAYAAHRAAWTETHGRDRSTRLWEATAALAVFAALLAIVTATAGGPNAVLLVSATVAVVSAFATWPTARWSLSGKRDAFYTCLARAVETAGEEAAHDYINRSGFQHRTIVHNLEQGLPATPKRVYKAVENAVENTKATA